MAASSIFTSRNVCDEGNPPATAVMRIGEPSTTSPTVSTNEG